MATLTRRRSENVEGSIFVDSTCIDCGTCRWVAPDSFGESGGFSRVWRQPTTDLERHRALMALVACPTGSIGTVDKADDLATAIGAFPDPIEGDVYHCGFHSEKSYGAASYFIRRESGNILIDSPRFARPLVDRIAELGGISLMILTHRDDIADHASFAKTFGCRRIIHVDDAIASTRDVETKLDGTDAIAIDNDLKVIPVPGHTRGSICILYRKRYLFTGDHLRWDSERHHLAANRSVCWYDWGQQTRSMERLKSYSFEWILPGHGTRIHMSEARMAEELDTCIDRMKRA